jgi:branched-chain amino acid transport system permease protein
MQILINGLIQGLLMALTATGFAVVYNSTGVLHIAQGAVFALSPFLLLSFLQSGVGIPIAISLTLSISIIFSMVFELINHWPLHKRGASDAIHLISSLGIFIIVIQGIAIIWGNETKVLRDGIDITYTMSDIIITRSQALGGIISLFSIVTFFLWLKKTDSGLKFMALSDNPVQLSLLGYDISRLRLLAFGVSGILTAVAAMLTAMDIGFDPHGGLNAVLLAIVATIIGGKGSFIGPVIGGILLGVIRSQVVWHISARWQDSITFLILVLFLFFMPQGIFGKKGRIEAL